MTAIRIRCVVGEDDGGRRFVLSAIEGDSRFDKPAERFLTCDRIVADAIVTIPIDEPEPAAEMVECPACIAREGCEDCGWDGVMTAEQAADWITNNRDLRITDDDRTHAWRERLREAG